MIPLNFCNFIFILDMVLAFIVKLSFFTANQTKEKTLIKRLTDICQMLCTCLPDALYMLDRCFSLLDRCFGLFVRRLTGCFTSSCQLSDKEHKANSKRLTETVVYCGK